MPERRRSEPDSLKAPTKIDRGTRAEYGKNDTCDGTP
jgi:hypothetical protein